MWNDNSHHQSLLFYMCLRDLASIHKGMTNHKMKAETSALVSINKLQIDIVESGLFKNIESKGMILQKIVYAFSLHVLFYFKFMDRSSYLMFVDRSSHFNKV